MVAFLWSAGGHALPCAPVSGPPGIYWCTHSLQGHFTEAQTGQTAGTLLSVASRPTVCPWHCWEAVASGVANWGTWGVSGVPCRLGEQAEVNPSLLNICVFVFCLVWFFVTKNPKKPTTGAVAQPGLALGGAPCLSLPSAGATGLGQHAPSLGIPGWLW